MAKKQSKSSKTPLARQDDAKAPLDAAAFLAATRPVLKALQADLLARADGSPKIVSALRARWGAETAARRTADVFEVWRRNLVAQVAAAWLLSVVFVRTLEDRGLLDRNRIAGPGALDSQQQFLQLAPYLSERDYLLETFRELTRIPAAAAMFDARHSLVWLLAPSAEGARALLALFRAPEADAPGFRFGQSDTRFLGDLYQDLDEDVRARYALLQTPRFIESFILDRTLERSIEEFGLDATTMIDPTCGSGHFLLGAFDRLFERRMVATPGLDPRDAVRLALDAVHGVDINPYSIAIARVRLTLAALERGGYAKLKTAPVLPLNLVVADSLLHRVGEGQASFGDARGQSAEAWKGEAFALEEEDAAKGLLAKRFAVVVGNPPYITVKDAALRETYRRLYPLSAGGQYSLGAPFTERFFGLALPRGFVGMITANSFMKREFGKKLIEEYLPTVNLEYVMNTSGAYIPGHGTPTVLLFGRHEPPAAMQVLGVLAKRGEPSTPEVAEAGFVWQSIASHWSDLGFENEYTSVAQLERLTLAKHPWSLGGGGAAELKELLEQRATQRLSEMIEAIGRSTHTGEDGAFFLPRHVVARLPPRSAVPLVTGEQVRDWSIAEAEWSLFPYDTTTAEPRAPKAGPEDWHYWRYRALLRDRQDFGQKIEQRGLQWWEHSMFFPQRYRTPLSIAFAFVATHNHFVLDRGGKVFKQSAPIIKLPDGATEDDHLALLAYLNSSTACFWMKQVFFPKYGAVKADHPDPARNFYEFAGTGLSSLPIPSFSGVMGALKYLSGELDSLASRRRLALAEDRIVPQLLSGDPGAVFAAAWAEADMIRQRAVFLQEELDWIVYRAYGIVDGVVAPLDETRLHTGRALRGERAFEYEGNHLSLVRRNGNLLSRAAAELDTADAPAVDAAEFALRESRRAAIARSPELTLLETNVFKRLWRDSEQNETESEFRTRTALRLLELAVVEAVELLIRASYLPVSGHSLRSALSSRYGRLEQLRLDSLSALSAVVDAQAAPYLAALRFTESGMEKRIIWERTWEQQRDEDAGRPIGAVSVPPKYDSKDYRSASIWQLRGKLDVPKDRFISYPGCESDQDKSPVYGWAGWNHLQQVQALAALYVNRKNDEGWKAERLVPMLAGILELVPWVKQWHNEPNADFGGERLGDYFARFVDDECRALAVSHDDLRAWRPAAKGSKRAATPVPATDEAEPIAKTPGAKKPRMPKRNLDAPETTGAARDVDAPK